MSYQLAIALVIGGELVAVVAVAGSVAGLLRLLCFLEAGSGCQHDGTGPGPGGGEDDPPDRPSDGDGGVEPVWWPRFEHEFAVYVARSGRPSARRSSGAHPAGLASAACHLPL